MKNTGGNKIRLGIFVSVGFVLFMAAIYFVGARQQLFSSTFHIKGIFKDISGLQVGNNVRFSGINVGVIGNIQQITDSTVSVDMVINEHSRKFIKKDATAIIGTDGLMGNKILIITPGPLGTQVIADNDVIATTKPVSMDDILLKIKITADNAAVITADFSDIIGNIHDGKGTIGKLFIDESFANNIDQALVNIKQGAGGFKRNMNAVSHNFLLRGFFKKKDREKDKDKKKNNE